ncbi:hypothetical protein [Nodosilinea sp. E11]|uniref:hypothetical protein n=1 Tax=Nodosilinea sp. E11 TaxID=3037479 RepID=UPI002935180F|nr:hypothetical protein [Nodosilinea sp. E11]WOD37681.1 hypothetical protein RRF56_15840 [Nodosilinea sp. E11]
MIPDTLIVPTEYVPSAIDIKRALLSYNKILLVTPTDRDVIPSRTFGIAMGLPPVMTWDMGPVQPMGKTARYDNDFDELASTLKDAIDQGVVEIISTYKEISPGSILFGTVGIEDYPLNPQAVFWIYRSMASDQALLDAVLHDRYLSSLTNKEDVLALALQGCGEGKINDIQELPLTDKYHEDAELRQAISRISYARLGSVVKYIGYCHEKNIVPVLPSEGYQKITNLLLQNSSSIIRQNVEPSDSFWVRLNRIQNVIHEDFVDTDALESLSIKEILKLRSKVWGKTFTAKEKLFESLREIALNTRNDDDFMNEATQQVKSYRAEAEELESEWKKVRLKLICEIGVVSTAAAPKFVGEITQIGNGMGSAELILVAGGVWFLQQVKEIGAQTIELQEREAKFRRGAGFGFTKSYPSLFRKQ